MNDKTDFSRMKMEKNKDKKRLTNGTLLYKLRVRDTLSLYRRFYYDDRGNEKEKTGKRLHLRTDL